jgi:hypothetical protein
MAFASIVSPSSIVLFQDPQRKLWNEVPLYNARGSSVRGGGFPWENVFRSADVKLQAFILLRLQYTAPGLHFHWI